METRSIVLVTVVITTILACILLASGWNKLAEDAVTESKRCAQRQRKRVADVPRITLGLHLRYQDDVLVEIQALQRRDAYMIDELYERLARDRSGDCDPTWLCLDNVVAVHLQGAVDSNILKLIVNTAWAAGYDIVATPPPNDTW